MRSGFPRYSTAPSFTDWAIVSTLAWAVIITQSQSGCMVLMRFRNSTPFTSPR